MESVLGDTIVEAVRQRLDLPAISASSYPTLATVQQAVRESAFMLSAKLRSFSGQDHFTAQATLTTTPGLSLLPVSPTLPCFGIRRLAWVVNSARTIDLELAEPEDWRDDGQGWTDATAPKYRFMQMSLELYPTPQAAHTVKLYYFTAINYVVGAFSTNPQNLDLGWQEWIVNDVCSKVRTKQEKAGMDFIGARESAWDAIVAASSRRDAYGAHQVRDLRGANVRMPRKRWF